MLRTRDLTKIGTIVVLLSAGCDVVGPDDAGAPDAVSEREQEINGFRLNGFRLNGFRLNGFRLNGLSLMGDGGGSISLLQFRLPDGTFAASSWLVDGNLHALTSTATTLSGAQLVGARLVFHIDDGNGYVDTLTVRVAAVAPIAPGSDVLRYDFTIRTSSGPWQPLCSDALGQQTGAVLLSDVWSPLTGDRVLPRPDGATTVACLDAALGKCVEWGYVPWHSVGGISLDDYHQTCTRAIRADYCGDGVSHTLDGTTIHVLDPLGIEQAAPSSTYMVEAEWGPDGAVCLNLANTRLPDPAIACQLPACGDSFASGGLIQTGKLVP